MSKRSWTGLLVGVVVAIALVAVGVGAYHAGQGHEITAVAEPVVGGAPGETVRVVTDGRWGGHWGGPPFGFLFPVLLIGLIVVLVAGRRRSYWGGDPGYCGPGWGAGRDAMLADWHRRAHGDEGSPAPPAG